MKKIIAILILSFLPLSLSTAKDQSSIDIEAEINCLAANIYHEARGESLKGKLAVGLVTMNRTKHQDYPSTVCGVVFQKANFLCQFSWACKSSAKLLHKDITKEIRELAEKIYFGEVKDITKGATHFHSIDVNPRWSAFKTRTLKVGRHIFYRKPENDTT